MRPVSRLLSSSASLTRWASPPDRGGSALPQLDIAQAHVQQGFQLAVDTGDVGKEIAGFLHRHVQHIGDGLVLVFDLQGFPVVAGAFADLNRAQRCPAEMHFDLQDAVALTGFAPAALYIEAEPAGAVTPHLGVLRLGKHVADIGEHTGIGGRVGPGACARWATGRCR